MNGGRRSFAPFVAVALYIGISASSLSAQTARETYVKARENLIDERFEQALTLFRSVVASHPESEEADDAQYYVGYTLERLGRKEEAVRAYDELIAKWPDSVRVETARSHRAELARYDSGSSRAVLDQLWSSSTSWELKRDTAIALARSRNLAASDVLEEIMRRESSSRQLELVAILADQTGSPTARRIVILGLEPSQSSSVQLRALQALAPAADQSEVTEAFARLVASRTSSSVKVQALQVLAPYVSRPSVRRAVAGALALENGSSVQIMAVSTLEGHLAEPEVRASVIRLFEANAGSSVQLKALSGLARDRDRPEVQDVLRAAVVSPTATSVKLEAIRVAGASKLPDVRAVVREGLRPENATSVQLEAVKAFGEGRNDPQASEALATLFTSHQGSTSVELAGLEALASHLETPAASRALAAALNPSRSTSVQLKALGLATRRVESPEVRQAILRVLEESGTSTSVELEAISLLKGQVGQPDVRRIVAAALRQDNSTSVQLAAVEAVGAQTSHADARQALAGTLARGYSTSVVLASMKALEGTVDEDASVRQAFIRVMEDDEMSSTARVRSGRRLLISADAALRKRIADAMEDVVLRLERYGSGHNARDLQSEALDVLAAIDPARAEALADRARLPRPRRPE